MSEFSQILKQFRKRAGLSQKALADIAELDASHINRLERDLRNPPKKRTIIAIANGLSLNRKDSLKLLGAAGYEITNSSDESRQASGTSENFLAFHSSFDMDFQNNHPTIKAVKEAIFNTDITPKQRKRIQGMIEQMAKWLLYESKKETKKKR